MEGSLCKLPNFFKKEKKNKLTTETMEGSLSKLLNLKRKKKKGNSCIIEVKFKGT